MEDLFKKFVNAGVGFVSLTTDRVQKTIDTLVKESKLSEKEGAKIMDELKKNGESKRKELEKQVQGLAAKMMKTVGVAPNSDVEELKRSVKGGAKSSSSAATSAKGAAKPVAKAPASKTAATAKGAVASATSKAASTVKKAADKTSATASKTQKSAAGSAGAAKKEENKAAGAASSQANS